MWSPKKTHTCDTYMSTYWYLLLWGARGYYIYAIVLLSTPNPNTDAKCFSHSRNPEIISIAMMGNYVCEPPSRQAMVALYVFLEYLTHSNPVTNTDDPALTLDYKLYGHCQINLVTPEHNKTFPESPGPATLHELMYWDHWVSAHIYIICISICIKCLLTFTQSRKNIHTNIQTRYFWCMDCVTSVSHPGYLRPAHTSSGADPGGGPGPPLSESLGIDFYSGYRKKIQV